MKLLLILALLHNIYTWQSPQGCYTAIAHAGNWYALISNVDHASDVCTNWYVQVFDSNKNQG